jgi:hypothetical protein
MLGFNIAAKPQRVYWAALLIEAVAFHGIRVQAGDHRVEMRFVPRILYWSAAISAAALLAVLIVGFRSAQQAQPAAQADPPARP